jgi:hypothetical protein
VHKVRASDPGELDNLMTAEQYDEYEAAQG